MLVGEPGVGKTAVAEGLAQRVARGEVPDSLRGMRIVTLDVPSMLAGTKYRGDFEERIKAVLREVRRAGDVIVLSTSCTRWWAPARRRGPSTRPTSSSPPSGAGRSR